ncbi:lipopolysaccharide biosynthesis protein RffC [Klebsiella pneumoniae]|uniref:Lipopolysaccharide biosynthesis protein RffC n=1 Tax=Klebsiella pneumoniae TaxID=573 RepID=A0A377XMF4_KLEPN|nr:lipopolysaccharide biosynthesis protein RffC [Klebsiella pneumoniae]
MVASAGEDRPPATTVRLDALQRLGFQLVEGEVDLALPVGSPADAGADVAVEADIAPLREQAAQAFAMSRFRAPWYAADASGRFYAQWIEKCGARHLRSSVPDLPPS